MPTSLPMDKESKQAVVSIHTRRIAITVKVGEKKRKKEKEMVTKPCHYRQLQIPSRHISMENQDFTHIQV